MLTTPAKPERGATLDETVAGLRGRTIVALTSAGVSTESGIPDYRSPDARARVRRRIHGPVDASTGSTLTALASALGST